MRAARRQRGWAVLGALMAISGLTVVITIGFRARDRELDFEDRGLQRAQARWAAESAIARSQSRGFSTVQGELASTEVCARVRYQVRRTPQGTLQATGWCGDARPVTIEVRVAGGRIVSWSE